MAEEASKEAVIRTSFKRRLAVSTYRPTVRAVRSVLRVQGRRLVTADVSDRPHLSAVNCGGLTLRSESLSMPFIPLLQARPITRPFIVLR